MVEVDECSLCTVILGYQRQFKIKLNKITIICLVALLMNL